VSPGLVQRQAALAAAALLATLGVLALLSRGEESTTFPPTQRVRWETAVVGVLSPRAYANKASCGSTLDSGTMGIAHPVLPCGVDLLVSFGGRQVRTEVVERGPVGGGRDFDLTQALAERLGVHGREKIQWRFAG
jgi:Lytic transglycolase